MSDYKEKEYIIFIMMQLSPQQPTELAKYFILTLFLCWLTVYSDLHIVIDMHDGHDWDSNSWYPDHCSEMLLESHKERQPT